MINRKHTRTHARICIRERTRATGSKRIETIPMLLAWESNFSPSVYRLIGWNMTFCQLIAVQPAIHSIALKTSDKSKLCKSSFMAFLRFSSVVCYLNDIKAIKLYYDILLIHKRSFSDQRGTRLEIDNRTVSTLLCAIISFSVWKSVDVITKTWFYP